MVYSPFSLLPLEHRHFIIIIGTTSSQLHCHDVESHDVAIWIQARACLVVVRPPMNKRKALGATSSGAAQLAAPCAKQSRASSSSAFSACCTGNQGEPPQAVALSAVPQGSTVAAFENGGLFQPPAKKCNRTKGRLPWAADGYQNLRRSRSPCERKSKSTCAYDEAFFRLTGKRPFVSAGGRDRRAPAARPWVPSTDEEAEERGRKPQDAEGAGGGDLRSTDADRCCICFTNRKTHAIQPCGHRCLCPTCVSTVENRGKCPLCRRNVEAVHRIYY